MASGRETVERFYEAFGRADGQTMAACYAPDASFADPVYPGLRGEEIGAMWRMLTGRAQDLTVQVQDLAADNHQATATWMARYLFGPDHRPVANLVHSTFTLSDGLITEQRDRFDFHGWSAMALGAKGRLLGWTPFVRNAVRAQAAQGLREFMAGQA